MIKDIKPILNRQKSKDMRSIITRNGYKKKTVTLNVTNKFSDVLITYVHQALDCKTEKKVLTGDLMNGFIHGYVASFDSFKREITLTTGYIGTNKLKPENKLTFDVSMIVKQIPNSFNNSVLKRVCTTLDKRIEGIGLDKGYFIIRHNKLIGVYDDTVKAWNKPLTTNLLEFLENQNPFKTYPFKTL